MEMKVLKTYWLPISKKMENKLFHIAIIFIYSSDTKSFISHTILTGGSAPHFFLKFSNARRINVNSSFV
jgi:hypothetical protein